MCGNKHKQQLEAGSGCSAHLLSSVHRHRAVWAEFLSSVEHFSVSLPQFLLFSLISGHRKAQVSMLVLRLYWSSFVREQQQQLVRPELPPVSNLLHQV